MSAPEAAEGFPVSKEEQTRRVWACPWLNEECSRRTPCVRCRGKRSRRKGRDKQRVGVRGLEDVFQSSFGDFRGQRAHEELMRGPVRIECKAGAQAKPAATRFLKSEAQSEAARPVGDLRPFAEILMPPQWGSDGIFSCRLSQLGAVLEAYARSVGPDR